MAAQCISCGMPLNSAADYAAGDTTRDYCRHCARPDGSMVSREEARARLTAFMVKTRGVDESEALRAVEGMMAQLPAWKDR